MLKIYIVADNVDQIIEALKLNFGRSDWLILNLIKKAKKFIKKDNVESFLQFSFVISNMITAMVNTCGENFIDNPELLARLEEKLPKNSKRSWAIEKFCMEQIKISPNLKHFSNWLSMEVNLLISVSPPPINTSNQRNFEKYFNPKVHVVIKE